MSQYLKSQDLAPCSQMPSGSTQQPSVASQPPSSCHSMRVSSSGWWSCFAIVFLLSFCPGSIMAPSIEKSTKVLCHPQVIHSTELNTRLHQGVTSHSLTPGLRGS